VQTICRTAAQQQTQHVRGCATASQPPQQEQQTTEETEEIKTESKQVRRFEKPKTEAEIQDEWRQTIHWRQPKEHKCTKPVDPSLVPIEDRQPIPSFPLQPGEKPTASNFVVPLPPPPVPVDPYFQDQDLPFANAVTAAWEATTQIYDNKRTVPFQDWFLCAHGEVGTQKYPVIVPSLYDKRVVTCCCAPEDTAIIYYILVHRGYMSRCPGCGNCFVLLSSKNCEIRKGV